MLDLTTKERFTITIDKEERTFLGSKHEAIKEFKVLEYSDDYFGTWCLINLIEV